MKKVCLFLIFLSFGIRLAGLREPLGGSFSVKQITAAMVAKNFVEMRHDWRYPRTHWTVDGEAGLEMTDLPLYYYLLGVVSNQSGIPLDAVGRFFSVLSTLGALCFLFLLARLWFGEECAWLSAAAFAVFPSTLVFGQTFQNDMFSLCLLSSGVWMLMRRREGPRFIEWITSALLVGLALLHRPLLGMIYLPCAFFAFSEKSLFKFRIPFFWIWTSIASALPAMWYGHAYQTGQEGSQSATSVFHQLSLRSFPDRLLWHPKFYVKIFDGITGIVFGPIGFAGLLGSCRLRFESVSERFVLFWVIAGLLPAVALPSKFYDLPYYFLPVTLPGAILVGRAFLGFLRSEGQGIGIPRKILHGVLIAGVMGASLRYAAPPMFADHGERKQLEKLGRDLDRFLPTKARLLVSHESAYELLYYSNRVGHAVTVNLEKAKATSDITRRFSVPSEEELIRQFETIREKEKSDYFVTNEIAAFYRLSAFSKHILDRYPCLLNTQELLVFQLSAAS